MSLLMLALSLSETKVLSFAVINIPQSRDLSPGFILSYPAQKEKRQPGNFSSKFHNDGFTFCKVSFLLLFHLKAKLCDGAVLWMNICPFSCVGLFA